MRKLLLGLAALTFLTTTASAGILFEPFVGYNLNGSVENPTDNEDNYDLGGLGYGARLGYNFVGLMVGGAYEANSLSGDGAIASTANQEATYASSNMGAFIGYQFPVMFRVWATYYLSSTLDWEDVSTGALTVNVNAELKGSGYGLGIGYTLLPMVSLNLEYKTFSYDEVTQSGTTEALTNEWDSNMMFFSVSVPFEI